MNKSLLSIISFSLLLLFVVACEKDDDEVKSTSSTNNSSTNNNSAACLQLDTLLNNFGGKTLYMSSNIFVPVSNPAPNPVSGICLLDDTIKIELGTFGDNNHQFSRNNLQLCSWNDGLSGVFSFAECINGELKVGRGPANAYYTISNMTDTSLTITYLDTVQNAAYNFSEAWEVLK